MGKGFFHLSTPARNYMLDVYTDATPNGLKISLALEELGLTYNVHRVFLGGEQKTPEFTKLNPNQKIPVLVDNGFVLTESGAILIYLAEKTGKLLSKDPKTRAKTIEMVMFQMASLGPMFGQLLVFRGPFQNKYPEVTNRYFKEVSRIFAVLNKRLDGQQYFAGSDFSIADIAMIPWVRVPTLLPFVADVPLAANPNLKAWLDRVLARPAVQKGLGIPEPFPHEKQFAGFIKATVGLGDLHA
jgi:GSH-dependent disulfide-bond oxidoreductase